MFLWYCLVLAQYSYYRDFFCLGPASRLSTCHCHMWLQYIDTTIITVACMSLLLLYIGIQRFCYSTMFYYKLTNGKLVKWWMVKWYNGEIKNRTGYLFSHKYRICSFVLFLNTTFLQQTKQFIIFNIWSLTTSTATKFILSNQATTKIQEFIRGQTIVLRDIMTLI